MWFYRHNVFVGKLSFSATVLYIRQSCKLTTTFCNCSSFFVKIKEFNQQGLNLKEIILINSIFDATDTANCTLDTNITNTEIVFCNDICICRICIDFDNFSRHNFFLRKFIRKLILTTMNFWKFIYPCS